MAAYVFISVGALTMVMGFLGCLGAVNEVRCLLGMVSMVPPALPTQRPHLILPGGPWPRMGGGIEVRGRGGDPAADYVSALRPQYFAFLLLILIAQVTAGVFFYFNMGEVSTPLTWAGLAMWVGLRVGVAWGWGTDKRPCGCHGETQRWGIPGMVFRTPCFHGQGCGFSPCSGS